MSFVVVIALVISALVAGVGLLAFRRRPWIGGLAGGVTLVALLFWFLHPVCVPIPDEDLANFVPPIETRTETNMIGQPYFVERDGGWVHCKTWIARQFFF